MLGHIENELAQLASRVENIERSARRDLPNVTALGKTIAVPPGSYATKSEVAALSKELSKLTTLVRGIHKSVCELALGADLSDELLDADIRTE